ncbi:putative F420-0 ABC transporter permease subunit [Serinibacter salmoneus]|uniref:Iron complex transport system permease protein n=1 Tax=Serinibacter salmoneus TaxID=556530 RepID=A0A2A9CYQ3_9MICO|nr:putative F420-0 ABC transporter permease subunit [Serinibacter salmoneus]PFG19261.1 iron complex transport system permease protein [Serinibacter salmoneus]
MTTDQRPTIPAAAPTPAPTVHPDTTAHPTPRRRLPLWLLVTLGAVALIASVLVAVTIGPADLDVAQVLAILGHHLGLASAPTEPLSDAIVWELRLPRVLTAACVGAGLALGGAVMQSLTRNPLADPYLLGLSSGASLGAVAVLVLGVAILLPVAAFAGALAALALTLALARTAGALTPTRAVLAGLAVSQLAAAGTSFVIFWTASGDSYQEILAWLMGSLAGTTWPDVSIAVVALVVVGTVLIASGTRLDAFTFGDTAAAALGINVARTRWTLLTLVALLTGAMVAVSGAIGFVGLVLPHVVAALTGPAHRRLLPMAALVGATFLIWADTLARTLFDPREMPVGIVTALIGVPVFAFLLRRRTAWS